MLQQQRQLNRNILNSGVKIWKVSLIFYPMHACALKYFCLFKFFYCFDFFYYSVLVSVLVPSIFCFCFSSRPADRHKHLSRFRRHCCAPRPSTVWQEDWGPASPAGPRDQQKGLWWQIFFKGKSFSFVQFLIFSIVAWNSIAEILQKNACQYTPFFL